MASNPSQDEMAVRLALVIKRIRARLRDTRPDEAKSLPISQLAILARLRDDGPTTATVLAAAEHVSQQAAAQHVAALRDAGLVQTAADPKDGRKLLVSITRAGRKLFDAAAESRNAWLACAIASDISTKELPTLAKAINLLERLAASDSGVR
ncbi:MAG TPA: MarR family transcriptional regulator [Gemmatimonadaceae bacterium]|jgi:DNA-binding MarR family transcriptional regulator